MCVCVCVSWCVKCLCACRPPCPTRCVSRECARIMLECTHTHTHTCIYRDSVHATHPPPSLHRLPVKEHHHVSPATCRDVYATHVTRSYAGPPLPSPLHVPSCAEGCRNWIWASRQLLSLPVYNNYLSLERQIKSVRKKQRITNDTGLCHE